MNPRTHVCPAGLVLPAWLFRSVDVRARRASAQDTFGQWVLAVLKQDLGRLHEFGTYIYYDSDDLAQQAVAPVVGHINGHAFLTQDQRLSRGYPAQQVQMPLPPPPPLPASFVEIGAAGSPP